MKLLSYNIRFGGRGREPLLAAVVRAVAPDLVVFQEATDPRVVTTHGRINVPANTYNNVAADNPRVYELIVPLTGHAFDVRSIPGMILVEGLHLSPLVFLLMYASFRSMDPSLEESAIMSGAPLRKVFFKVTLPLARPAPLTTITWRRPLAGIRALVVDDNAVNREILRHQLAALGMAQDEAENGMRALEDPGFVAC